MWKKNRIQIDNADVFFEFKMSLEVVTIYVQIGKFKTFRRDQVLKLFLTMKKKIKFLRKIPSSKIGDHLM